MVSSDTGQLVAICQSNVGKICVVGADGWVVGGGAMAAGVVPPLGAGWVAAAAPVVGGAAGVGADCAAGVFVACSQATTKLAAAAPTAPCAAKLKNRLRFI
jgi:hypothetical protein